MSKNIYLDSGVILSLLREEPNRADIVKAQLRACSDPKAPTILWTSTMTIVEVVYLAGQDKTIDPGSFRIIDQFWQNAPIKLVEVNEHAAKQARSIMRDRLLKSTSPELPKIKGRVADLSHIGTAIWMKADEFWTWDCEFNKYPVNGIEICQPYTDQLLIPGF